MSYTYRIYGTPVPWKAPKSGKGRFYQDKTLIAWQAEIRKQVAIAERPDPPYDGALQIVLCIYLPRPKNNRTYYPSTHGSGDDDNYMKALKDALNAKPCKNITALVWTDDCRFVDSHVRLFWAVGSMEPGVEFTVYELEPRSK